MCAYPSRDVAIRFEEEGECGAALPHEHVECPTRHLADHHLGRKVVAHGGRFPARLSGQEARKMEQELPPSADRPSRQSSTTECGNPASHRWSNAAWGSPRRFVAVFAGWPLIRRPMITRAHALQSVPAPWRSAITLALAFSRIRDEQMRGRDCYRCSRASHRLLDI